MRCEIPQPCCAPSAKVFRINRSSVPCSKSSFAIFFTAPPARWSASFDRGQPPPRPVHDRTVVHPRVVAEMTRDKIRDRGTHADHAVAHQRRVFRGANGLVFLAQL